MDHAGSVQEVQEIATLVRSIAEIRRLWISNPQKLLVMRGTAQQGAMAEWLVKELEQREGRQASQEYVIAGNDVLRVFYLTPDESVERLQEVATKLRSTTQLRRLFTYNAPRAIALRGTAEQIAMAGRLIRERER